MGAGSSADAIKLRQHDLPEAENALRRALQIDGDNAFVWGELGLVLAHDDKRIGEANAAYQRALRINQTDWFAWSKLLQLKARTGTKEELLSLIQEFFHKLGRSSKTVILAGWTIRNSDRPELLPRAVDLVRAAVPEFPDDWKLSHTLASLLAQSGDWKNAIAAMSTAITASANSERALKCSTDFLISAAANGYASEVLTILDHYGKTATLEPLTIGVRIYSGERPIVAQEVLDVGEDVAKRIKDFQLKSEQNGTNSEKTGRAQLSAQATRKG